MVIGAIGGLASPATAATLTSTRLEGSAAPHLDRADRLGEEDAGKTVDVQLVLKLRNQAELDGLIRGVSTPGNAEYGQYLTPAEFNRRFGPAAAQVETATTYLRGAGFEVTGAAPGSTLVNARTSAGTIARAMATRIGRYRDRQTGREFFANDTPPSLPATLAPMLVAVVGLDSRYQRQHAGIPCTGCASAPYVPVQVRTGYGLAAAPLGALSGSGQTMGLLELDYYVPANIAFWDTNYSGFSSFGTVTPLPVDGGAAAFHSNGGEVEAELDIEVMQGYAHDANILVFEGPNSDNGVNDAYNCMVNPDAAVTTPPGGHCPNFASRAVPSVISTSWGLCELSQEAQTPGETATLDGIFQRAAAQGQSVFAASGDNGAYDCRGPADPNSTALAVDSPASDPYVTGTGGTRLVLNSGSNTWRSPEDGWTDGSGGGLSSVFGRPPWQAGPGVINAGSNGRRQVPDVALDADPQTGYLVYSCGNNSDTGSCMAQPLSVGGTSAAAPAWAAFAAIFNQYAGSQSKPVLGFANPRLYGAVNCPEGFQPIHDAVTGDNFVYGATPGWDYVTGLGSLNAAQLAQSLAGGAGAIMKVTGVSQPSGTSGDTVTVTGCGFQRDPSTPPTVTFGNVASPKVDWLSTTAVQAVVPSQVPGPVAVTVTNPGPGGATSNPAGTFTFVPSGFTLDGYGGVHPYGAAPPVPDASHAYWGGWNIARGVAVCPENNHRGYTLDGYGGIHRFGDTTLPEWPSGDNAYWSGWDIGRAIVLTSCSPSVSGYVLDGWGGLHQFGGAPATAPSAYWPGWDIAVGVAACPDVPGTGYTLDAYGGIHPFGAGLTGIADTSHAYWAGWRIARAIALTHCAKGDTRGYTLDGWGGVHAFSNCRCVADPGTSAYWPGWDIARGIQVLSDGSGGYVLDGWGGLNQFGNAPAATPGAYWRGWDIARGIGSGG
jgi:kumamolisin